MYKQVIVIRKDLNMRKGKIAAQASHASMKAVIDYGFYEKFGDTECLCIPLTSRNKAWLTGNFKKICVYVNSEEELLALFAKANEITECALIQDSGLTEFAGVPTYTAIAVGPDENSVIDSITGGLPLL